MGVEDKDFIMRQIKQLGEGLGTFLGKEDVDKILSFDEDAQKEKEDETKEKQGASESTTKNKKEETET